MRFTSPEGLLAETLCRTDRIREGFAVLADQNTDGDAASDNPVHRAKLH